MKYPTGFDHESAVLAYDELSESGQDSLKILAEEGYEVRIGLARHDVGTLHALSLQPSIKEYCPNDCTKRFKDEETASEWLQKGRATVMLIEKTTGEVAGYGWIGEGTSSHVPGGTETFALRISENHQGRGLATPYSQVILDVAANRFSAKHLWLEAWQSNGGAVHIYEKLGFKLVDSEPSDRPTADDGTATDTRLYMSL